MSIDAQAVRQKRRSGGQTPLALRWLKAGLGLLQAIAPGAAEAYAVRIFFTPRSGAGTPLPEVPGYPAESLRLNGGRFQLAGWSWGSGPLVLLLHGWDGYAAQMTAFVPALVEAGYRAVALELPAHGRSSGRRVTVLEAGAAVRAAVAELGPVHGVVAHSYGGPVTALAMHSGMAVERVVFVAPGSGPAHFARGLAQMLGLNPERAQGVVRRVERALGGDLHAIGVPTIAAGFRSPLLVVHDPQDRIVPFEMGQSIAQAWPGARLAPVTGLGHGRILRDPTVVERAVGFLSGTEA